MDSIFFSIIHKIIFFDFSLTLFYFLLKIIENIYNIQIIRIFPCFIIFNNLFYAK